VSNKYPSYKQINAAPSLLCHIGDEFSVPFGEYSVDAWPIIWDSQFGFSPEESMSVAKMWRVWYIVLSHKATFQIIPGSIVYAHSLKIEDFIWKAKCSGKVFPLFNGSDLGLLWKIFPILIGSGFASVHIKLIIY
jgi:hypothetical protein